jgi:hypothetical protein
LDAEHEDVKTAAKIINAATVAIRLKIIFEIVLRVNVAQARIWRRRRVDRAGRADVIREHSDCYTRSKHSFVA